MTLMVHFSFHQPNVHCKDEEHHAPFSYDVDDPCIEEGVVFPDVKQCKEAVTQHTIIYDHTFRPTRTDHNKFRALCKRAYKDCKWRFYATTSKQMHRVQGKNMFIFMCSCVFVITFSHVFMTMLLLHVKRKW
jgi:hypothetical protein